MDSTIKKILERVLFLNESTGALKDQPHLIQVEEIEKKEKFLKTMRILVLLFLLIIFVSYLTGKLSGNIFLNGMFSENWMFLLFVATFLVSRFFTIAIKLTKVSEQKFLVKLLNENRQSD
jgi:hypothetical protein